MDVVAANIAEAFPDMNAGCGVRLVSFLRSGFRVASVAATC